MASVIAKAAITTASSVAAKVTTRTTSSVAAEAVTRTTWSKIKNVPIEYPFAFGFFLSGFKTSGSDILVQKLVEQREEIDWRRNSAFAAFGFFYLGGVQYSLYVPIFGRMFPGTAAFAAKSFSAKIKDARGMFNVGAQVFIDQCVHHPLMYFPVFYCTKELVMSDKPDLMRVLSEYRTNMSEDLQALWKIWVPATIFNFAFMPMWGRIPCVAATSAVWTMVLSSMRGGDVSHGEDMAGGAVTAATFTIMEEGLGEMFTRPVELARDKHHMVISASGLDKVGWTAEISRAVANAGGNVTHSKMVRLGTEFIIVMHVAVEPENQRTLTKALKSDESLEALHIQMNSIARRMTGTFKPPVMGFRIRCIAEDKPGLLATISESLADKGLSIESIVTDVQVGRNNRHEFVVNADCIATSYMDHETLSTMVADLGSLKQELKLDTFDVRVQRLVEKLE